MHPLGCSVTYAKAGVKVYPPAATTDGKTYDYYAIPEGARIQLNPDIDLDSLELSRTALIVARAAQEYGIVVKECGGSFAIYAEHSDTADWDEWGMTGSLLWDIPMNQDTWRIIDYDVFGAVEEGFP